MPSAATTASNSLARRSGLDSTALKPASDGWPSSLRSPAGVARMRGTPASAARRPCAAPRRAVRQAPPVDDQQLGRVAPCEARRHSVPAGGPGAAHAPRQELIAQRRARQVVAADDQHAPAGQLRAGRRRRASTQAPKRRWQVNVAAPPRFAGERDVAVHQQRQPLADRQAQPGAAEAPRGRRVRLREGLEQPRLRRRRDADAGVADGERDQDRAVLRRGGVERQHHRALRGELDRVAEQVEDDLAQARRIAEQAPGDARRDHRRPAPGPWRAPARRPPPARPRRPGAGRRGCARSRRRRPRSC